jgi:hypothetical protein
VLVDGVESPGWRAAGHLHVAPGWHEVSVRASETDRRLIQRMKVAGGQKIAISRCRELAPPPLSVLSIAPSPPPEPPPERPSFWREHRTLILVTLGALLGVSAAAVWIGASQRHPPDSTLGNYPL